MNSKRNPRQVEEFITGKGIGYPAKRDYLVKFAEGKQASSDFLGFLKGIPEIDNTSDDVTREIERL